jgi:NifU-like protein involved in Fe-S cluster formation
VPGAFTLKTFLDTIQPLENQTQIILDSIADGCGSSIVCGSFAAEMAVENNPDELLEITGEAILKKLGKLPEED